MGWGPNSPPTTLRLRAVPVNQLTHKEIETEHYNIDTERPINVIVQQFPFMPVQNNVSSTIDIIQSQKDNEVNRLLHHGKKKTKK